MTHNVARKKPRMPKEGSNSLKFLEKNHYEALFPSLDEMGSQAFGLRSIVSKS